MARIRVFAILSQKGGAGKSTLTMQLAGGLAHTGRKVTVLDLDPQQTSLRWASSAPEATPFPAAVVAAESTGLRDAVKRALKLGELVLLDCPPSIEHPATLAALDQADLVLVPVVPSPADLWSTKAVERLVLQAQQSRRNLKAALVPNRVVRTNLAWDVLEVMRDFALPVLGAALSQRNAYAQSAVVGASVHQLGRGARDAAKEVDRLVTEVLKLSGEKT